MATDSDLVQRLVEQLGREHQAYVDSTNRTHELLQQILDTSRTDSKQRHDAIQRERVFSAVPISLNKIQPGSFAVGTALAKVSEEPTMTDIEVESVPQDKPTSAFTGDSDEDSGENDSIFVQTPLQQEQYDLEGLRRHVGEYRWSIGGKAMLNGLNDDLDALARDHFFPHTALEAKMDRSHLSHYSIYDVGSDGVPLDTKPADDQNPTRALEVWNRIRSTNTVSHKRPVVGRIVIVREPSPKIYAALHYTMHKHFDVDEMFDLLRHEDPVLMHPHRAFDEDERHRRTFLINLEYFTIIGDMCKPQKWQRSDEEEERSENHIPISRCSSVIALSLEGPPMTKVKNRDRRIEKKYGDVYDPFSPWRVLSIQAYPDWHATTDTHKPSNHYVNGPEAFLYTVEAEFNDARKRLKEVYNRVGDLVEPPQNFIFNSKVREALLFEDDKFTYSKKYFWAYQTLSIVNQDITEMIESYRETFKDAVWEGTNKIIWPGDSNTSFRYQQFRKRMEKLRHHMDEEVERLEYIKKLNSKKMQDIEALRENLFSGTSVMESRRSVEQTRITIEQNRSIMLLTLVTIFFLPLTFVTSVFGMTNVPPTESFAHFSYTVIAVCIPTYVVIGSLHTDAGLSFWSRNKRAALVHLGSWLVGFLAVFHYRPGWADVYYHPTPPPASEDSTAAPPVVKMHSRSSSITRVAMKMRQTAGDQPPGIIRLDSREDAQIPRPQMTSGDAAAVAALQRRTTPDQPLPRRPSEVAFSPDDPRNRRYYRRRRSSVATTEKQIIESVSPRNASPNDDANDDQTSRSAEKTAGVSRTRRGPGSITSASSSSSSSSRSRRQRGGFLARILGRGRGRRRRAEPESQPESRGGYV